MQHKVCYLSLLSRFDHLMISSEQFKYGEYCGETTGQTVLVSGSYVVIKFHSDENVQEKGFLLLFTAVQIGKLNAYGRTSTAENGKRRSSTIFLNKHILEESTSLDSVDNWSDTFQLKTLF